MQKKYTGKWPRTLTFTQYNTHYKNDTVSHTSIWYEALEYPDKFRIDFGELAEGNAVIFANDSVYQFKAGELKGSKKQLNNLMLLDGGMYFLPPDKAMQRLKEAGYNLNSFREDVWQGRAAYVVGAGKGDLQSNQFWIDKQNLYLVRTITVLASNQIQEAQFSKHIRVGGGWTETEVVFVGNGKLQQLEVYKNVQADKPLPEGLFNAHKFGQVHWLP
jgi:hypothetical protein